MIASCYTTWKKETMISSKWHGYFQVILPRVFERPGRGFREISSVYGCKYLDALV